LNTRIFWIKETSLPAAKQPFFSYIFGSNL
jgi:hypothetical protein